MSLEGTNNQNGLPQEQQRMQRRKPPLASSTNAAGSKRINPASRRATNGNRNYLVPDSSTMTTQIAEDPAQAENDDESLCSFCQETRAVLRVQLPHPRFPKRKKISRSYCLLHYYTTPAARKASTLASSSSSATDAAAAQRRRSLSSGIQTLPLTTTATSHVASGTVEILDSEELEVQLSPMQELFAEAFVQLQQELTEEAAQAFSAQQQDPLAILHNLNKNKSLRSNNNNNTKNSFWKPKKQRPPPPSSNNSLGIGDPNAGGFLRDVPLPERLVRTHEKQAQIQRDMEQRMEQAAATSAASTDNTRTRHPKQKQRLEHTKHPDISKRRKSSRKSIWNTVMEEKEKNTSSSSDQLGLDETIDMTAEAICTCGSKQVQNLGLNASRNQDLKKGETWGVKDRGDEVLNRLQCHTCGKIWSEEA